jgi:arylsulfatase A-like enzyme
MTGRIPSQHGVHDWLSDGNMPPHTIRYLEGLTCYTDILAGNGYTCGLSGKWHLGDSMTPQHGFSHWFCMPKGGSRYQDAEMIRGGRVETFPGYLTDVITDDALAFIEANKDRPFYLSVNYNAPHTPFTGHPKEIVDSYDDCPFASCPQEAAHPWAVPDSRRHLGNRESLKGYFAAITGVDINVGRIVDKLQAMGLTASTLVIFSSDNGYSCGHHGFWHKGNATFPLNMYENSVKVPMVFSQPGRVPAGKVPSALVSQYDFMPTLLEYLNLPAVMDPTLPGRSFLPALLNRAGQAAQHVVVYDEYGPVRMIRTPEWKYVHRYPYGPHELYDLKADADERRNLVDDKSKAPVVDQMRRQLAGWFARYVRPELDGARMPCYGRGQKRKIDPATTADEAFATPAEGVPLAMPLK